MTTMKDTHHLVGTRIDDFELPGSAGETRAIASYRGTKHVVIVLLRSKY